MNRIERGLRQMLRAPAPAQAAENIVTGGSASVITGGGSTFYASGEDQSLQLSAVFRCVEVISDSIGKLPVYILDRKTRQRVDTHPALRLLTLRPNDNQTRFDFFKMIEASRLCGGNGYAWIERDPRTAAPVRLTPIPYANVTTFMDHATGHPYYSFHHPWTDAVIANVPDADMVHVMAYSHNGYKGISVLERASEVISTGRAAQQYSLAYYTNGGQPSGVLQTESDLSGTVTRTTSSGTTETVSKKDIIREEWNKRYAGPSNANQVAVLDYGLKYTPVSITNRDAQFVEQENLSVEDIARFFGVPLYKLQAGKQSYSSNEQNAIEYVVGTLHPIIERYEQELTYKLLTDREIADGLEIRIDLLAEMRGDTASRGNWYRTMREVSAFSPNDIREMEDLPDVPGGDDRYASLNYVPLRDWAELSRSRNAGTETGTDGGGKA